mgnify:CR=1 FL=1
MKCGIKSCKPQVLITSIQVFTNSEIIKCYGVTITSNANTVVLFANGDAEAQKAHVEGSSYLKGIWYAVLIKTLVLVVLE